MSNVIECVCCISLHQIEAVLPLLRHLTPNQILQLLLTLFSGTDSTPAPTPTTPATVRTPTPATISAPATAG